MRKLILVVFCTIVTLLQAQTIEQAKNMLSNGELPQAEKALKKLATRKNAEANLLLGQLYLKNYRFDEAEEYFKTFKSLSEKAKKPITEYEKEIQQASTGTQMMLGIADIAIIDTFVVDKRSFLQAYKLGTDAGYLFWYNDFFQKQGENWGTVYMTELENYLLYSENGKIYSSTYQLDNWSVPNLLPASVNGKGINNYPFLCTDGITLYFSSTGDNSLGGYDIFVTRYDADKNDYLQPDNVGMPFNSPYNDYMMAIDELNNLGWFASDRYQPEGKVCIYVFIPDENKTIYDIDSYDENQLIRLARITSYKESWKGHETQVKEALARLNKVRSESGKVQQKKQADFYLVINDETIYTTLDNFQSPTARKKASEWMEKQKRYSALQQALNEARDQYAQASAKQKKSMALSILDQEKRIRELETDIEQTEMLIRNTELKELTK